ncbi:uncharacterized protein PV07_08934 [Cladophialophora immunda]|uniref:Epoxide hydrolase N-terminal domain-containing protein n=1 Tax=Cladophialophora immunda TaxID=569365 RepID=A0A0D2CQA7_9EURO|nr:uncharacterized protein PV07_08934 [Cladophialophora immunda]KIW25784.1 hypothetical protein PV07_08934 [Cladophialophora immunda]
MSPAARDPASAVPNRGVVRPMEIRIPDDAVEELKTLIRCSKIAGQTYENSLQDGSFGVSRQWLLEAKRKWEEDFDWRRCEARINKFPQFTVPVQAHDGCSTVHFCGLFSDKPDAIPLLLLHGWPGSFLEFLPILALLQDKYTPETLPYHVIVPSLPGYGFSARPPLDRDFTLLEASELLHSLMEELGFGGGYIAQGGDVGSKIARILAKRYQGCKVNFCAMNEPAQLKGSTQLAEAEREGLERMAVFNSSGRGYAITHATRPSTIALVLTSNPLTMLAWIGEKFLEWSGEAISIDTILESVTLYWLTETLPTSLYTYRARTHPDNPGGHGDPRWHVAKPLGYSYFPKEVAPAPVSWVATTGDLIFSRSRSKGGHFAAAEVPELLLQDIEDFAAVAWPRTNP